MGDRKLCEHCQQKPAIASVGDVAICIDCMRSYQEALWFRSRSMYLDFARHAALMNHIQADMDSNYAGILPPTPPIRILPLPIEEGDVNLTNISIDRSTVGVVNTGNVQRLDAAISLLQTDDNKELRESLTRLSEAVLASRSVSAIDKDEIVQHLSFLAQQTVESKESRMSYLVKQAVTRVRQLVSVSADLLTLWQVVEPALDHAFA